MNTATSPSSLHPETNTITHVPHFSFEADQQNIFAYLSLETITSNTVQWVISRTKQSVFDLIGQKLPDTGAVDVYRFDDVSIHSQSKEDEELLRTVFTEFVRAAIKEYVTDREIRISIALSPSLPEDFYQQVIDDLRSSNEIDEGKVNRAQGYVTFTLL